MNCWLSHVNIYKDISVAWWLATSNVVSQGTFVACLSHSSYSAAVSCPVFWNAIKNHFKTHFLIIYVCKMSKILALQRCIPLRQIVLIPSHNLLGFHWTVSQKLAFFDPDMFSSKVKVLTFNSETHWSQHILLIGILFNAILSRELLPLQKYAGKSQKWEWWRLWLCKKCQKKDDESTEKSKLIGSRLTGNQQENITKKNKLNWPSSPHFSNLSLYFYLYPCLHYFPYPYVICFPVMKGEMKKQQNCRIMTQE